MTEPRAATPLVLYDAIDLADARIDEFAATMHELRLLLARDPVAVDIDVLRLEGPVRAEVYTILGSSTDIATRAAMLGDILLQRFGWVPRLIVACAQQHELAAACRENNPQALWGGTIGPLAVSYCLGNRFLAWHEALHLMAADDCYDLPNRGPICEQANCIMQYDPTVHTVGPWPWLCRANAIRVRQWAERFRSPEARSEGT